MELGVTRIWWVLLGAGLVAGGVWLGWALFGPSSGTSGPESLTAEVAHLRSVVEAQADRIARLERERRRVEGAGAGPEAAAEPGATLAGREEARPGAAYAPTPASVQHGREVLAELQANTDGQRVVAIRNALQELVRVGDAIVPDIVALLDALREIGTPAAKEALLGAVGRSGTVSDFRDLLVPYLTSTDPVLVEGIAALIPHMLRQLGEVGIASDDYEAQEVATYIAFWIRRLNLSGVMEHVEALLLRPVADPEARHAYDNLFSVLVEYAPERAANVALTIEDENPGQGLLLWFSREISTSTVPRAQVAVYYRRVFSRTGLPVATRAGLYGAMPDQLHRGIEDPVRRIEDARPLVDLMEARLASETEHGPRYILGEKLERLRNEIEQARK